MCEVAVITTGFFDGVHLGHRHVLETVVSSARERGEEAVVVTFWPHPRTVLQQDAREFRLLSSLEEKKAMLATCGIDRVEVLPFTREFASMTAADYLAMLRDRFGATLVVMGYDNRIGSDCLTAADLSAAGTEVPVLVSKPLVLGSSDTKTPVSVTESSGSMTGSNGPTAEGIYFSQGFAKNQIPSAIANPTHNYSIDSPTAEENYFSQSFAKNQFSSAIANPTHTGALSLLRKEVKHQLTHRTLIVDFYLWEPLSRPELPEGYVWIKETELDRYGKPRLFELLLESLP